MPELPEVETVRRGLARVVTGWSITGVVVANPKVLRGQLPETLRERLLGRRIQQIDRRGKYLLVRLSPALCSFEPLSLCIHLKMRGQMMVEPEDSEPGKYHCVTIVVRGEDPAKAACLRFYDAWTWGELRALYESELASSVPALAQMGPEPLTDDWTGAVLGQTLAKRRTAIKPTLLDQKVVAGVGNIYADEALYRSRIHPQRVAGSLTPDEVNRLADAVKTILTEAVEGGGTTSENFFDVAGDAGRYEPQVYERGGLPCRHCAAVLTRIRLAGRSAVFCESCQPLTR
ncbi:MAG: bifunctional DNA-formamidopyrimidine glycosylase/DNA-(apurinic or apyrimidinic site) lyase [Akkermansiaceae bacterium]|nr:bifunctional DNA-formamidopyrimidine glycosylase/DNA-(apurinic or apyrimidinic site) lyase [Armatimonadota bacterium]